MRNSILLEAQTLLRHLTITYYTKSGPVLSLLRRTEQFAKHRLECLC